MPESGKIESLFDDIAPKYDSLNKFMSFGLDRVWRKKLVRALQGADVKTVLDVATGTADVAVSLARAGYLVTGVDISERMLQIGREKVETQGFASKVALSRAKAESLPFETASFDAATVSFGVRNFENLAAGLGEMCRVLKNGGRLVVLELSYPDNPVLLALYKIYTLHVIPLVCGAVSGNAAAYRYLPQSVLQFPKSEAFMTILQNAGFGKVKEFSFSFGVCRMYVAEKNS